ncbi:hypothetical protein ES705_50309 [subsurface metagenome]
MSAIIINGKMEYRLTNIPEDLWHQFRVQCVQKKTTLRQKLLKMVEEEVAKTAGKR